MAWIIGDVHGCIKTLESLLKKLPKVDKVIFVGDLIDRGENSKEVVQLVRDSSYDCVLGNHELSMIENGELLLGNPKEIETNIWTSKKYDIGGMQTLSSYKRAKDPINEFKNDIDWMKTLPLYLEYPDIKDNNGRYLVVTHSYVDDLWNKRDSNDQFDKDNFKTKVLYSRNKEPKDNKEIFNIFGHTPVSDPIIKNHFANIDTGAYYTNKDLGVLTALEFPSMRIIQQENIDTIQSH